MSSERLQLEWDERKRRRNLAAHDVDFLRAAEIFDGPVVEDEDRRNHYGERRHRALGRAGGEYFVVVYTWRDGNRRLISAWRVGSHGRRRYQALLAGRDQGEDPPRRGSD